MPPLKLKKKRKNGGGGSSLLNHMRSRRTTFRLVSPALRSSHVTLTSPTLTSAAVDNSTARASTPLEITNAEGKHKMEIKREEQQSTTGEDEEEEWAGCVFKGDDDTSPIAPQSELPTPKSLGAHPATSMVDRVPTTQPEKDVVKVKQEVDEDESEDGRE